MVTSVIANTFNVVYPALASQIMTDGRDRFPRGTVTKELHPVMIQVTNPRQRLVTAFNRPINVAFALAEVLWILGGREDVEMLNHYNSRIKDYSDDGKVFNASYGDRLRKHFGHDQLRDVISTLEADPDSRQATLVISSPSKDRGWNDNGTKHMTKDRACLAGESLLWSPEGDKPIREVASLFKSGKVSRWPVYSVDPDTLQCKLAWATNVWRVGTKPTVRLSFDDGTNLRLTRDHKLYIKRRVKVGNSPSDHRTYVRAHECAAGDLVPGDRILATRRFYSPIGHEYHKKLLNINTAYSNRVWTHQEYDALLHGPCPTGIDIHHKNEVKTDNRAGNLQRLPHGDHAAINMTGDRNPMRRLTAEQHAQRGRKHSEAMKRAWEQGKYASRDNHLVVGVEDGGCVPVYDFTVPGFHTALVGTGVVAHNCNVLSHLMIVDGKLDWLQIVRSNDLMWGTPYNWMQFTHLQEYVATSLGIPVGSFFHVADSLHIYDYHFAEAKNVQMFDLYGELGIEHEVMKPHKYTDVLDIEQHIRSGLMKMNTEDFQTEAKVIGKYWADVVCMLYAHNCYLAQKDREAYDTLLIGDAVYAAAQARFWWSMRWSKTKPEMAEVIKLDWEDEVAEWILTTPSTASS